MVCVKSGIVVKHDMTNYFNDIRTELQAYLLGWFWSRGSGRIQVSETKKEIIYLVRDTLAPHKKIYRYNNIHELNLSKYKSHLIQAGCVFNKHIPQSFPQISSALLPHFLRGLFDSYGTIILAKGKYLNISLVYDDCFIKELRSFLLQKNIKTKHYYRYTHTNTIQMLITSYKSCLTFLSLIYYNSSYYLTRNFQEYQKLCKNSV